MNKYALLMVAALGGAGMACSADTGTSSDTASADEVESYLAALEQEVTEEVADEVWSDEGSEALPEDGAAPDEDDDWAEGEGPRDRRYRRHQRRVDARRAHARRHLGHPWAHSVDLILFYGDFDALEGCRELHETCVDEAIASRDEATEVPDDGEQVQPPGCFRDVRDCIAAVRNDAFALMCEERTAECEASEVDSQLCDRIENACALGMERLSGDEDVSEEPGSDEADATVEEPTEEAQADSEA